MAPPFQFFIEFDMCAHATTCAACMFLPHSAPASAALRRALVTPSCRWEDGQLVSKRLTAPDRWDVHRAERLQVTLGDLQLRVVQQVWF